ncbi:hypothetical protein MIND_00378900 [Mycena indigotica]|uniref:Uncharacterized protein n=1 Tax=Mycena indigotica TaxID=2126181 RepID=A0A8H6WF18_9AGAR|nr:uncharacterized protein MIND_00378900 [Mycena indigotica]KAF7310059.1 hypothetical protein MIND_00378900 [Mycena indigotica]
MLSLSAVLIALPASYGLILLAWHILRHLLLVKHIGTQNLRLLQATRSRHDKIPGTAVVCGGGIAGLLTARVCHAHFKRVLLVEAEAWLSTEDARRVDGWKHLRTPRARLMQWNSLHSSQAFLFAGLENLFPNIEQECERSKIKVLPARPRFSISGAIWRPPPKNGLYKTMYTARHSLETFIRSALSRLLVHIDAWHDRRLVLDHDAYPDIEFAAGTVIDVLPDEADPSRLGKAVIRLDTGMVQEVPAALIADCTGPARAGAKWLARHRYGGALDSLKLCFDQKLRYSSMSFTASPEFMDRLEAVLPPDMRGDGPIITFMEDLTEESKVNGRGYFIIWRKDGNQIMTFAGHTGEVRFQPSNVEGLREYMRSMYQAVPIPDWLWRVLDLLEEIEDTALVSLLKVPATSYLQYYKARNLPSNFVALGDSVMTINPIFGEGCTKALRCAMALHTELLRAQRHPGGSLPPTFAQEFFAEERDKTEWLWDNTRVLDYGVPTTEPIPGESLSSGAGLRWYITWLQRLAPYDDHAGRVMYDTVTGFSSPIDALHPNLVAKVLWRGLVTG